MADREFEYKAKWLSTLAGVIICGGMGIGLGCAALNNKKGGVILGFELPLIAWVILWWFLSVLMFWVMIIFFRLLLTRIKHRQRIVITLTALIVPQTPFSPLEATIPYDSIDEWIILGDAQSRVLELHHLGGVHRIAESSLPSTATFIEIWNVVQDRIGQP